MAISRRLQPFLSMGRLSGPDPETLDQAVVSGNQLFIVAGTDRIDQRLWVSDGTAGGTGVIAAGGGPIDPREPTQLTPFRGGVAFTALDGLSGRELWSSDGTTNGTRRIADLGEGALGIYPTELTAAGSTLFFVPSPDYRPQLELWASDGSAAGTRLVKVLPSLELGTQVTNLTADSSGSGVYFTVDDSSASQLWRSDGTTTGTTLISEFSPTLYLYGNAGREMTSAGGRLFFIAHDPVVGQELWVSDGTSQGTRLLKDINPGLSSAYPGSYPSDLTVMNGQLFFVALDEALGFELWRSDGTEAGTVLVKDINPDPTFGSYPTGLTVVGQTLYFTAASEGPTGFGFDLWATDGTEAGTHRVTTLNTDGASSSFYPKPLAAAGSRLLFVSDSPEHNDEIWITDGTAAGTSVLTRVVPASEHDASLNSSLILSAQVVNGQLLYETLLSSDLIAVSLGAGPQETPLSTVGGVALLQDPGNGRFWVSRDGGPASAITWGGAPLAGTTLPDWQLLAAAGGTGDHSLLWRHRTSGDIATWSLDDNWVSVGGSAPMAPSSTVFIRELERRFLLDLDGNGLLGPISSAASSSLAILSASLQYAITTNGAAPVAISRFGSPVATSTFPDWAPIALASDSKGNALLWKNSRTGDLLSWSMNDQWAYTVDDRYVTAGSSGVRDLERRFLLDLDGNGILGPISSAASSSLAILPASLQYAITSNGAPPIAISRFGSPVATSTFPDWAPIALASDSKGNALLWKNSRSGALLSWAMNAQWAYTADLPTDETRFLSPIKSSPSATLGILPSSFRYAASNGSSPSPITRNGSPVTSATFTDWAPISAATDSKGNALLWKNSRTGDLLSWSMSPQWAYASDDFAGKSPSSPSLTSRALEQRFNVDLDGDGSVPLAFYDNVSLDLDLKTTLNPYTVATTANNALSFAPITRNGARLSPTSYADWSAIALASNASGNKLLWKNSRTGDLLSWSMNAQWAYTADDLFSTPASPAVADLERRFSIDLNGDNLVGTLAPVSTPPGPLLLGTLPTSNAYAISLNGGAPITITRNAAPLSPSSYPDWTAICASDSKGNALLWKNSRTGDLLSWSINDQWAYTADGTFARPGSAAIASLETRFSIDLDADGRIATTTIAAANLFSASLSPTEQLRSQILAADPNANAQQPFSAVITGGAFADTLTAPAGDNVLISGYDPVTGIALPAGAIDNLDAGLATSRCTVLLASPTGQPFANDGDSGYTLVRNFDAARDDLVLPANLAITTASRTLTFEGATVTGLGLHLDTNNNGAYDNSDNLIALLAGVTGPAPRIIRIG